MSSSVGGASAATPSASDCPPSLMSGAAAAVQPVSASSVNAAATAARIVPIDEIPSVWREHSGRWGWVDRAAPSRPVGCGHGLHVALLAQEGDAWFVYGADEVHVASR